MQADQGGADGLGREVEAGDELGRDVEAGDRHAGLPVEVDGLHRFEADVQRAVDRAAGRREDADDAEGLVGVFEPGYAAGAVAEGQRVADAVAQAGGDFGAEHGFKKFGERLAGAKAQRFARAVAVVAEVVGVGAEHRKAAVRIAERERHAPGHGRVGGELGVALPAQRGHRLADAEDGVQNELQAAAARADDEVGAREGVGVAGAGVLAQAFDREQQRAGQGDRQQGEAQRQAAVPGAGEGEAEERWKALHAASSSVRSK